MLYVGILAAAAQKPPKVDLALLLAVAGGTFVGMIYPVLVALFRHFQPRIPVASGPAKALAAAITHSNAVVALGLGSVVVDAARRVLGIALWLLFAAMIAAVVAAFNVVPMVTGASAQKLQTLGGWQYFFLASEGFGLASILEQGMKPQP